MSVLPFSEVSYLFTAIRESGVWEDMRPVIDRFAEEGDDVGEAWARWVYQTRRRPKRFGNDQWNWLTQEHGSTPDDNGHFLPYEFYRVYKNASELNDESLGGVGPFEECYLVLLAIWRLFSDEQRQQAIEWGNRIGVPA